MSDQAGPGAGAGEGAASIPSFVSDFVSVVDWEDSEGVVLFPRDNQQLGKQIISQRFTYSWTIFTLLTLYTVYCTCTK